MVYEVLETSHITAIRESIEPIEQEWVSKIILQLKINPYTGKPLGTNWFREKKFEGKRLYYLIFEQKQKVLLVAYGDKKEQSDIIAEVHNSMDRLKKMVE